MHRGLNREFTGDTLHSLDRFFRRALYILYLVFMYDIENERFEEGEKIKRC